MQTVVGWFVSLSASELRLLLNVEAYDYTDFSGEGIGLRLIVDGGFSNDALLPTTATMVFDASTAGGAAGAEILLSPGSHASVNIRRTDVSSLCLAKTTVVHRFL